MTAPQDDSAMAPSRPARGRLGRPAGTPPRPASAQEAEAADVAQGQAAAVLGALARMQLRLDVLAREQSDMFARLLARLEELESALLSRDLASADAPVAAETAWVSEVTDDATANVTPSTGWQDSGG